MNTWVEDEQTVLSTTPERWQRLVSTLPIDLLTRPPAEGEWSALRCLQHLVDAESQVFPVRLHAFLTGQDFVDFDPNQQHADLDAQTSEQLMAAFFRSRQEASVANKFKFIRNKHILKSLRVKRVERVLLFFYNIYSRRYYTLNLDELKIICNTIVLSSTAQQQLLTALSSVANRV